MLNAHILCIGYRDFIATLDRAMTSGGTPALVITANVDHLYKLRKDAKFLKVYNEADYVVADGVPLVWASSLFGNQIPERINGTDLMLSLCELASKRGYKIYLLGGEGKTAEHCSMTLQKRLPDLKIVGYRSPEYPFVFPSKENDEIVKDIREKRPDIVFVGLGAPKQEFWIQENKHVIRAPVSIGVGVSFRFLSGELRRAPRFMQRLGLEWFWRLTLEPYRLIPRYVASNLFFIAAVAKQIVKVKTSRHSA